MSDKITSYLNNAKCSQEKWDKIFSHSTSTDGDIEVRTNVPKSVIISKDKFFEPTKTVEYKNE